MGLLLDTGFSISGCVADFEEAVALWNIRQAVDIDLGRSFRTLGEEFCRHRLALGIHRLDRRLDEGDLFVSQTVLLVELLVSPGL